jgi:hypothetical protein
VEAVLYGIKALSQCYLKLVTTILSNLCDDCSCTLKIRYLLHQNLQQEYATEVAVLLRKMSLYFTFGLYISELEQFS